MKWIIKELLAVDVTCSDQNGYKSSPVAAAVAEVCSELKTQVVSARDGS